MHPGEPIYTIWDYFVNPFARDAGLRIDHLLLSSLIASCLVRAEMDSVVRGCEKASDQAPRWIELAAATETAATSRRAVSRRNR
jgi:exodeoxyribonuclease-3